MSLLPATHAAFLQLPNSKQKQQNSSTSSLNNKLPFPSCHITSVICRDGSFPVTRQSCTFIKFEIRYSIFRPMSNQLPPLIVLHGGPSLPSSYLYPLVDFVSYRKIIFYDQLGCGKSSRPLMKELYSIQDFVQDLKAFVDFLKLDQFYLYGHSFGGILGFEYVKKFSNKCIALILSSTPTNIHTVEEEALRLQYELIEKDNNEATLGERFHKQYICKCDRIPQPLADAYFNVGTIWTGTSVIHDYVATYDSNNHIHPLPPVLVLRGEFDFVTEKCMKDWNTIFGGKVKEHIFSNCSHHALLENGAEYGAVINEFLKQFDPQLNLPKAWK